MKFLSIFFFFTILELVAVEDGIPPEAKKAVKKMFKDQNLEQCIWHEENTEFRANCRIGESEYPELMVRIQRKGFKAKALKTYREDAMQLPEVKPIYDAAVKEFTKAGLSETEPQIISVNLKANGSVDYYYVAQMGGMYIEFKANGKPRSKVRERSNH